MELSKRVLSIAPSQTLQITAMAKEMQADGFDVIGFAAGEPDFDTPRNIKDAAIRAIDMGFTKYTPAAGTQELRQAVCDTLTDKHDLHYRPDQIVVSNGAKHSLSNVCQAILNPGDEVIVMRPYWLSYPELIKLAGGVPVYVDVYQENSFVPSAEDIERAITPKTKAIIVNNPSNPCGCVYPDTTLREIAKIAEDQDIYIISDEIYSDLVYDNHTHNSIAHVSRDAYERTIVVNGLSKSYAMTGWRIGFTASPTEIAKAMASLQSHSTSNPCSIAQYAGVEALTGPQDELIAMRREFDIRRRAMVKAIREMYGVSCATPQGAFYVMMNITDLKGIAVEDRVIETSMDFTEILMERTMTAVVPGSAFGADKFVRLSYATSLENIDRGMARIAEFLEKLKDAPGAIA